MKQSTTNNYLFEISVNVILIATVVSVVLSLYYINPVHYNLLIAEDSIGEYCTAVSFALSGSLMVMLSFKCGTRLQKLTWVLIGIGSIVVAAEEISWGQRILSITPPDSIRRINLQSEITLHNLPVFFSVRLHKIVSYMILSWLTFSILISSVIPRLKEKITSIGLPLGSFKLVPIFLTPVYFFLIKPIVSAGEIGEMLFGIAMLILALDMVLDYGCFKRWSAGMKALGVKVGMLFLIVIISITLAFLHSTFHGKRTFFGRMNRTVFTYAGFGMYDHAQKIFEYIYAHPEHIRPDTRINHGKILLDAGRSDEAFRVLTQAADLLKAKNTTQKENSEHFRRLGVIFMLLGQSDQAETNFNRAIEIGNLQLRTVADPHNKAELLFSIAQTLEAKGDKTRAIDKAEQAKEMTTSGMFKKRIIKWIWKTEHTSYPPGKDINIRK